MCVMHIEDSTLVQDCQTRGVLRTSARHGELPWLGAMAGYVLLLSNSARISWQWVNSRSCGRVRRSLPSACQRIRAGREECGLVRDYEWYILGRTDLDCGRGSGEPHQGSEKPRRAASNGGPSPPDPWQTLGCTQLIDRFLHESSLQARSFPAATDSVSPAP